MPRPSRPAPRLAPLAGLLLGLSAPGCVVVDAPLFGLRAVAGGIHNRRHAVGIEPFFLPDGRMGCAVNGGLWLEEVPGGELRECLPASFEVADPSPSPDGRLVLFVAGGEQITAGGGHNDHVFQTYVLDLATRTVERITRSRRAEALPRFLPSGGEIVFVRRVDYEPWALYHPPWGEGAVMLAAARGGDERALTPPLFHPYRGLAAVEGGAAIVFGAAAGEEGLALHRLALVPGAAPELLVPDAFLPAAAPGGGLVYVRGRRGGEAGEGGAGGGVAICAAGPRAEGERVLWKATGEVLALAVAPDGERILFTEFDPAPGHFGAYVLREVARSGGEARALLTAPYRGTRRFKVGDLVQPLSWWGRAERFSPGSR
ncbi:MAG: hypothetical protein AB1726_05550 [Planctomycetota bacterium]